eukprot:1422123-Pyramimonas_sp.AAC.1
MKKPRLVVQISSSMSTDHAKLIAKCLKYMCAQGCSKEQTVAYRNRIMSKRRGPINKNRVRNEASSWNWGTGGYAPR